MYIRSPETCRLENTLNNKKKRAYKSYQLILRTERTQKAHLMGIFMLTWHHHHYLWHFQQVWHISYELANLLTWKNNQPHLLTSYINYLLNFSISIDPEPFSLRRRTVKWLKKHFLLGFPSGPNFEIQTAKMNW